MRYGSNYQYMPFEPEDYIQHLAKCAERELLDNVFSFMEHGKYYTIRIEDVPPNRCGDRMAAGFRIDLTECQTERVKIPTLEEAIFVPRQSLFGRIKNCIRYLKSSKWP